MDGYDQSESWRRYREILAARFGVVLERAPVERWQEVAGHSVHIDDWAPEGHPRGTVILVHGGGGNGRLLAPFCDAVAGLGWRALAPDLPGFGLTRPAPGFRWDYADWPRTVAALADAVADTGGGPVVLIGASIGGLTALYAAQEARAVAGVVATTLLDMSDEAAFLGAARWRWMGRLGLVAARIAPGLLDRLPLPLRFAAPLDAMSSAPEIGAMLRRDPLVGRLIVPMRFWRSLHDFRRARLDLPCPLLVLHPGADRWTAPRFTEASFARVGGEKRFVLLSNGAHLPLEQPAWDELVAETSRFLAAVESAGGADGG